jgi:hypothetical protein
LGDIKKDKHQILPEQEIRHCHLVTFLATPKKGEKRTHPRDTSNSSERGCQWYASFCKMAWTAKKDILMADIERWWHLRNPSSDTKCFEQSTSASEDVVVNVG